MTLSSGQLVEDEGREPTATPAMPEGGVHEVKQSNKRTVVVRLLPNGFQHRKLLKLADACAKLYNEINYERRQQFFREDRVDFKGTWNKYYNKYKSVLGAGNAQAVMQKNNEAWSSFFSLLKLKKEEKLPPFIKRISPPKYYKERENKKRKKILIVRQDRYVVDEENHKIILKDFHMEVKFAGRLQWYGRQGRLEIIYDEDKNRFYAYIPVEVGAETKSTGKPTKNIVKGERRLIQKEEPKGNKTASIDLGINILASVVVDDGTWLLYKGTRAKEDFFYLQKKIAEARSLEDRTKNMKLYEWAEELRLERRRLEEKLKRRIAHLYRTLASDLIKRLWSIGVSTLYIGYPYDIAQERGNKLTDNFWSYRNLMNAIELKAQEYGIKVYEVIEYNTSRLCAYHGVEVVRNPRGVVKCPLGHKLHSDLNGALNILKKAAGKTIQNIAKPLSYFVLHNGVAPAKGSNARDPGRALAL